MEYDIRAIRAARVTCSSASGREPIYHLEATQAVSGSFSKDEALVEGLKDIKGKISPSGGENVVTCVAGKQLYVAQIPFRRLPDEEMANALKFEIRRNLPFEVAGATIEYQYVRDVAKKGENTEILVTAVAGVLLSRHLRSLEKAGLKPTIVDVLPLAVANSFRAARGELDPSVVNVVLHVGPEMCSLVLDGDQASFYHRTIYFSAGELFGETRDKNMAVRERERRLAGFGEELVRSLTFYESNFTPGSFSPVSIVGAYSNPELVDTIKEKTGLSVDTSDLVTRVNGESQTEPGVFDVATALAMRAC